MLANKRNEVGSQANKLRNGLFKIDDCKEKVKLMSIELEDAQVQVEAFQQQCDEYLVVIMVQRKEADEQQVYKSQITWRLNVKCQNIIFFFYLSLTKCCQFGFIE